MYLWCSVYKENPQDTYSSQEARPQYNPKGQVRAVLLAFYLVSGGYWGFHVIRDWGDFFFVMREFNILFSVTCDGRISRDA